MADWVKVADVKELVRRRKLLCEANGIGIALFLDEGHVYALRDVCIHKQRNLSKGLVFQGKVICPGHQWAFDITTGWVDEWGECQPTFPVRVEGGEVFVDPTPQIRPEPPPPEERWPQGRGVSIES